MTGKSLFLVLLSLVLTGCQGIALFFANAPTVLGAFRKTGDLAYGPGARHKLDVYVPANTAATAGLPVVIFWYGGAWTEGSKSQYRFVGAALAERGFVTVLPDYRVYPQVRFPEFVDDGARAVAWVEQHIAEYGGDPQRIVLMGHSAGAHMAALLALDAAVLQRVGANPASIVGLVGLSGPYVLVPNSRTLNTIFTSPYGLDDWQPIHFVSARSPPALLIHGRDDKVVSLIQSEQLRDALRKQGVRVETQFYEKRGHADTVASFSLPARKRTPALQQTVEFIESVTAKTDPSH